MSARDDFWTLFNSVTLDTNSSKEDTDKFHKILRNWIIDNIPDKLYQYRAFDKNEYNINSFTNDEIWGTTIQNFNDPNECAPFFDKNNLWKMVENHSCQDYIKMISLLDPNNNYLKYAMDVIKAMGEDNFITCFTEDMTNDLMWAHYAAGHTGFCLEYDFKADPIECDDDKSPLKDEENINLNYPIMPIHYTGKRCNATAMYASALNKIVLSRFGLPNDHLFIYDYLSVLKCLISKSDNWAYEKEWRLFSEKPKKEEAGHSCTFIKKPSAVYMGNKITLENEFLIKKIAQDKNIPCYKMTLDPFSDEFSFSYKQIL